MIHKIKISNFKSINELELELGRVNVLIGENGCGKTNILEAIVFGSVGMSRSTTSYEDILISVRGARVTETALIKPAFEDNSNVNVNIKTSFLNADNIGFNVENYVEQIDANHPFYTEEIHGGIVRYSITGTRIDDNENGTINPIFDNHSNLSYSPDYLPKRTIELFGSENILNFVIFCPENYFLRRFEEEGQIKPLGTRGEGLFKHLVKLHREHPEIIQKMNEKLRLIDWFGGFEIPNDLMFTEARLNIKDKYIEGLEYFDQRSANEGFLHLLFYFTLFMSPYTPGFFAIDNIDTALNPKLAARLLKELTIIAKENNKQVLLTTHNPGLLDGLDLKDDDQRLFSIYRDIDGETSAYRIEPPKPVTGVEPVRLSEAFVRGYIGALPENF